MTTYSQPTQVDRHTHDWVTPHGTIKRQRFNEQMSTTTCGGEE